MNNGTASVIFVDAGTGLNDTYLDTFDLSTPGMVNTRRISQLPGPRLESIAPTASSHDIRAVPMDFNDDGLLDVIVIGYGSGLDNTATHRSEIQFLQNKGNGVFQDVTDTTRIGFDVAGGVGYTPQVVDANQDGLLDLFLSMPDWLTHYNSTTLLLQQPDHTFVDTARSLLTSDIESGGGQGLIVQGPDNTNYLVSEGAWDYNDPSTKLYIQSIAFTERSNAEQLTGTRQADNIDGMAGNDTLTGAGGDDTLNGGDGTDTATYTGNITSYSLRIDRAHKTVVIIDQQTSRDGQDTLHDIERIQFGSQTFDIYNPTPTEVPQHSISRSFLFDSAYYLISHPELNTLTPNTAVNHYLSTGAAAGYKPNAWFDPTYYANRWNDLKDLHLDAATLFQHYNLYGVWEGRSAGPMFDLYDGQRYLNNNPDVAAYVDAHVSDFLGSRSNGAIAHYIIYGANEGRIAYDTQGNAIESALLIGILTLT